MPPGFVAQHALDDLCRSKDLGFITGATRGDILGLSCSVPWLQSGFQPAVTAAFQPGAALSWALAGLLLSFNAVALLINSYFSTEQIVSSKQKEIKRRCP